MTPIDKAIEAFGTQKKLAEALGVSPQFINQIKRRGGELTIYKVTLEQWVKVTGLSVKELFPKFAKLI